MSGNYAPVQSDDDQVERGTTAATASVAADRPSAQLEFGDFGTGSGGSSGTSASPFAERRVPSERQGGYSSLNFLYHHFDVDTKTVLERCWRPLIIPKNFLSEVVEDRPDLYGPFWLTTTVIFCLFVFSSLAGSITAYINSKPYEPRYDLLGGAVWLMYTFGLGFPVGLWMLMRYWVRTDEVSAVELINLFGYSNGVWIIVALLAIVPHQLFRWALVAVGLGVSLAFILRNLMPILTAATSPASSSYSPQTPRIARFVIPLVVAVCWTGLAIALKVVYFGYKIEGVDLGPSADTDIPLSL